MVCHPKDTSDLIGRAVGIVVHHDRQSLVGRDRREGFDQVGNGVGDLVRDVEVGERDDMATALQLTGSDTEGSRPYPRPGVAQRFAPCDRLREGFGQRITRDIRIARVGERARHILSPCSR